MTTLAQVVAGIEATFETTIPGSTVEWDSLAPYADPNQINIGITQVVGVRENRGLKSARILVALSLCRDTLATLKTDLYGTLEAISEAFRSSECQAFEGAATLDNVEIGNISLPSQNTGIVAPQWPRVNLAALVTVTFTS